MRNVLTIILLCFITAYSGDEPKSKITLTGEWIGQKQELRYMVLTHENGVITGQIFESKGHDRMDIRDAKLEGKNLTFHYSFMNGNEQKKVNVELVLSDNGESLSGKATIKDAGIELKLVFNRSGNEPNKGLKSIN